MNILQFSGTRIYLFCLYMKPVRDNLGVLPPFSDLKELISRNRCKTKTKPYFLWSLLFQSMKLQKCITQESSKEGLHPQCQAFLQSVTSIINDNPVSIDFLLDRIYITRPCSSYITLFQRNIFFPACFPLDNN